jgi:hypothetical protein
MKMKMKIPHVPHKFEKNKIKIKIKIPGTTTVMENKKNYFWLCF